MVEGGLEGDEHAYDRKDWWDLHVVYEEKVVAHYFYA